MSAFGILPVPHTFKAPSPVYNEKKPQRRAITEQELKHALEGLVSEQTIEPLPYASETPSISDSDFHGEARHEYPSEPNGASLLTSTQSVNNSTNVVGFFESFTGKFQKQAKLTFPITSAFLNKVFNSKTPTDKDAFAVFDGLLSSLKECQYTKLTDFEALCKKAPEIKTHLKELENRLDSIKDDFHDKSIYQKLEGASREETQAWLDKRSKVEYGLASLGPVTESLNTIINSLKSELPSTEQSFGVRLVTGFLSALGYIIGFVGGVGAPLFCITLLSNLGFETHQYLLKQKIKEWEALKKPLDELSKKNPLLEKEVINQVLAQQYRTQTAQIDAEKKQTDAIKDLTTANDQQALDIKEIKQFIGSAKPFLDRARRSSTSSNDSGYLSSSPETVTKEEFNKAMAEMKEQHAKEKQEIAKEAARQTIAALQEQGLLKLA